MQFTKIGILGLFGSVSHEIDLQQLPFFLVGPNGSGKTTVLKSIFFACTGQWSRLNQLPIAGVEYFTEHHSLVLEKSEFLLFDGIGRLIRPNIRRRGQPIDRFWPQKWDEVAKILKDRKHSPRYTRDFFARVEENYETLALIHNAIEASRGEFLYFPTYRRVERDLKDLLGDDEQFDSPDFEPLELSDQIERRYNSYGEVVGFGGQDIASLISQTAEEIRQKARLALNEHSIGFLEALATTNLARSGDFRYHLISGNNAEKLIDKVQNLAPERTNLSSVRIEVEKLVQKLKTQSWGRLKQKEDMLLYYLKELHELTMAIDRYSTPIINLTSLLNKYLQPKKSALMSPLNDIEIIENETGSKIIFDDLSSGEKQVVAFFSFLLLNKSNKSIFVILDEPELSLSVSWQKSLIRDMIGTGKCSTIISATHSPFIVEDYGFSQILSLGE